MNFRLTFMVKKAMMYPTEAAHKSAMNRCGLNRRSAIVILPVTIFISNCLYWSKFSQMVLYFQLQIVFNFFFIFTTCLFLPSEDGVEDSVFGHHSRPLLGDAI